ncbi:MAG: ATP-dependent sacrificial sulfur transferase LarE [Planctomycetota bacterium]|nr:ATP-dependent sacrificial sulfur transferase LarE [Planctomycetota bacterium]MDA1163999.1 ATP-dependent sacrificial sulfur transferase LarE [Planctomycetota bacterium]
MTSPALDDKRERLLEIIRGYGSVAVAFSAGVDSTVVAKAAVIACGDRAVAVTAVSPSLASGELDEARELAKQIGIRHEIVSTDEFNNLDYLANPGSRCYFCKTELYAHMRPLADSLGLNVMLNGANVDDLGDYRPGMAAAKQNGVRSPLVEAGFTKNDVRALARLWDLPVWDKPATPCLSSRIAYGVEVTPERVRRIDAAERLLSELLGIREVRVRLESGELARIEVPLSHISQVTEPEISQQLVHRCLALGFRNVTLDLQGFRSGSMNSALSGDGGLVTLSEFLPLQ